MDLRNDFVKEELVEINIDGRKFKYKPVTAGEENEWLKEVLIILPGQKEPVIDWGAYNKKKVGNIREAPYNKEIIKEMIGIEKDWSELTAEQKYQLLSKLKPKLFDKLLNAIKKIDEPDLKELKNL